MAKVVQLSEMQKFNKENSQRGDRQAVANILNISLDAARTRLLRGDVQAVETLYTYLTQKDALQARLRYEVSGQQPSA